MTMNSRRRLTVVVAAFCWLGFGAAHADDYPSRPIRVISPFAPGGGLDVVLRPLLQKMGEILGKSLFIDNKSGANGRIGIEFGVRAAPDGYTLIGVTSGAVTINPNVYSKMSYDTARDIVPVVNIASAPFVMVVNPSVKARNVKEFIALAKGGQTNLSYGSPGVGGTNHLGAEYFLELAGLKMVHVPYRGSQPMISDLMSGQIDMAFDSVMATVPLVHAGMLRALGIAASQRSPIAPDIPTLAEQGGPKLDLESWYGIMAPAGTPQPIIAKLNDAAVKALADPKLRALYASLGLNVIGNSPQQFAVQIRDDTARWAEVARTAHIKAD
jgi:tripartite-type tricarboxylate transporter receptor subunit TctC